MRRARPRGRHVLRRRRPQRGRRSRAWRVGGGPGTRDDAATPVDPRTSDAGHRGGRRARQGGWNGPGRCVRHRGRRAGQHVRVDGSTHRRCAVDHFADPASEDDRPRGWSVLPDRREVRRGRGGGHRADHARRRRRRRDRDVVDDRDRQGLTAGAGRVKGTHDRPDFWPRSTGTPRRSPNSPPDCSSPRRPAKACWRSCRSARRSGPRQGFRV